MRLFPLLAVLLFLPATHHETKIRLSSPDERISLTVGIGRQISYEVCYDGHTVLEASPISLTLSDGTVWGSAPRLQRRSIRQVRNQLSAFAYKKSLVADEYNELSLQFREGFSLDFRVYDDGIAYRFVSRIKESFRIQDETAEFHFPTGSTAYVAYVRENGYHADNSTNDGTFEEQFFKSFVNTYTHIPLSEWDGKRLAFMPLLVETPGGEKVCLTEADLLDYPGMYLNGNGHDCTLKGVFAPYPKTVKRGGAHNMQEVIVTREDYIARCDGPATFPWRSLIIVREERQLLETDMVYKLASPSRIPDTSWIKPGKAAWEWWSANQLSGVDFVSGINTETYKYFVDFAAGNRLEYVLIDAGWYRDGDLFRLIPGLNLEEVVSYARSKGVGILLWTASYPFMQRMENACRHYSAMGVSGFKIDYMDRDDQAMVAFHRRAAETASRYHLVLDFHGTYKPTGLNRTYPNVLNFEAVQGLEHMKWAAPSVDQVGYDVTMPFIRMVAGPLDYTQGAMHNASRKNYRPIHDDPMSQGTRCRQLAEYVVFEAPLSMLCDSPSRYEKEAECTALMARIPVTWDQTIGLNGEIGHYVTVARRAGEVWYIGALNDWTPRQMDIDLSFLDQGSFRAELYRDGVNASTVGEDYRKEEIPLVSGQTLSIPMAPGGGFIMIIEKD